MERLISSVTQFSIISSEFIDANYANCYLINFRFNDDTNTNIYFRTPNSISRMFAIRPNLTIEI